MSTLILSRSDVMELLSLRDCIPAVEQAFRLHAEGRTFGPGVLGIHAADGGFHIKAAGLVGDRAYFAAKTNANVAALVRLGTNAVHSRTHALIGVGAAAAALLSPLGAAAILLLCGGVGLALFYSKRVGALVIAVLMVALALVPAIGWSPIGAVATVGEAPSLARVVALFSAIGAVTFSGGIAMIALLEDHLVAQLQWLTPQEFIAGLALGQLTPGPVLVVATYVGYKLLGVGGAVVAAAAVFLPSFVLMLAILPVVDRVRTLAWTRAAIQGIAPAVIGVMAVALARLVPHAAPDPLALAALVATVIALIVWRLAPLKLMLAGSVFGVLRHRV